MMQRIQALHQQKKIQKKLQTHACNPADNLFEVGLMDARMYMPWISIPGCYCMHAYRIDTGAWLVPSHETRAINYNAAHVALL